MRLTALSSAGALLAAAMFALPLALPAAAQETTGSISAAAPPLDLGQCPETAIGLQEGVSYRCACPTLTAPSFVYGSGLYTPDSNICTAAVHAGALQRNAGGNITIAIVASPPLFKSETKNGVQSQVSAKPADDAFQFASG